MAKSGSLLDAAAALASILSQATVVLLVCQQLRSNSPDIDQRCDASAIGPEILDRCVGFKLFQVRIMTSNYLSSYSDDR